MHYKINFKTKDGKIAQGSVFADSEDEAKETACRIFSIKLKDIISVSEPY